MTVAGTAMGVALVTTWAAQRSSNTYGVLYCMVRSPAQLLIVQNSSLGRSACMQTTRSNRVV